MEEVKVKENTGKENTENAGNVGKSAFKHWAIIGIAVVLIVLAGAMIFVFGGSSAKKLQKQLDLGQKYLEEMNYEEAVVAFEAAIEIDPMSVDAYLGLVEVYIRTEEFDTALEYAKKGYEATGDERLKEKMEMIESENKARELQKQLDLGQQYLEEMNYEEAATAFKAAIEIDPMSVDAYLGLVEVYIRTGEFDAALEYAKKGYEATGDERLKEKIDMIESGDITASNGWEIKTSHYDGEGVLKWYEVHQYGEYGPANISVYSADGGLVDEGEYQYDEEGRVLASWVMVWDKASAVGVELYKNEYEYDSEGNQIAERSYDSDGTLDSYTENEYDLEGNLITERRYNGDGTLDSYTEYEYDSEGNMIVSRDYFGDDLLQDLNGALQDFDDLFPSCIEYEYDLEGNQIASREYDSNGILIGYAEYEYDSEGNQIASREYDSDGTLTGYTEYEYDSEGSRIAERIYDSDGILTYCMEFDSEGQVIAERGYDSDGTLTNEWEYDLEGNRITREYDGSGNLLWESKFNGDGFIIQDTEYEYDSEGKCIAERNYDGDGTLMSETRYE